MSYTPVQEDETYEPSISSWSKSLSQTNSSKYTEPLWQKALQSNWFDRKNERYAGMRLHRLEKFAKQAAPAQPFQQAEPFVNHPADLVLTDGFLSYKNSKISFLTLNQAMQLGPLVANRYKQIAASEKDPWVLVNAALSQESIFCRLDENFTGQLHVYFDRKTSQAVSFPRLTLWVPKHCQLSLVIHSIGSDDHLAIECVDIIQDAASDVNVVWARKSGDQAFSLSYLRAYVKRDATLKLCDLSEGGQVSRLDAHVELLEENASCELFGLSMLEKKAQSNINVLIEHAAPNCTSSQLFKTVVKDQSKNVFQGKIFVHPQAQQTRAYQLSRNLVLSDSAIAQSRPNLEILADDVKASHGSTTGQVDQEPLFYMLSRGISLSQATALFVHGFLAQIVDKIVDNDLKKVWKAKLQRY